VKVTTQGHLLFQLHPLVRGTKGKDSGLLATPNTMDHLPPRSPESTKKLQEGHRKGRTKPSNLREQVDPATMRMYPTPAAYEDRTPPETTHKMSNKNFQKKMSNLASQVRYLSMYPTPTVDDGKNVNPKPNRRKGLVSTMMEQEQQKMYPTPTARDYKDTMNSKPNKQEHLLDRLRTYPTPTNSEHKYRLKGNSQASKCLEAQARRTGGKLNPNFVEFLMGFPMDWTKVELEESKD
jgi:hypothetical protein